MSKNDLTWVTPRKEFEAYRWDNDYYDPLLLSILHAAKKQSSHTLAPYYAKVHPASTVKKQHASKIAVKALSVRDVESGFIFPHVPRYIESQHGSYAKANTVLVTRAGIQGIAAPVLDLPSFWSSMKPVYTLSDDGNGLAITSDLLLAEIEGSLSAEILAAYISSPVGRSITRRLVYGISNRHLRTADVASMPIPDLLKDFETPLELHTRSFYEAMAKLFDLSEKFTEGIIPAFNSICAIAEQNILVSKADPYRLDYSWNQFVKIRDVLAKLGFFELERIIGNVKSGGSVKKSDAGFLVLGTRDLKPNAVLPRGEKPRIVEHVRESNWANTGDLLMAEVGGEISVGTTAVVPREIEHWKMLGFSVRRDGIAVSSDIMRLQIKPRKDTGFISVFLNSPLGRVQLGALSFTTKQTRIRSYEVGKILIPEPKSSNEYIQTLEQMNSSIIGIRKIIDIQIPKALGLDTELTMRMARPYMARVKPLPHLNSYFE